ncbi:MAG: hypothetical protein K6A76_04735 [Oribacterium sp.]|nr:hypothetical protein [Oribacterium sp.]
MVSFSILVKRWFVNAGHNYIYLVKALLEGNIDDMMDTMSEICEDMISTFDGSGDAHIPPAAIWKKVNIRR